MSSLLDVLLIEGVTEATQVDDSVADRLTVDGNYHSNRSTKGKTAVGEGGNHLVAYLMWFHVLRPS